MEKKAGFGSTLWLMKNRERSACQDPLPSQIACFFQHRPPAEGAIWKGGSCQWHCLESFSSRSISDNNPLSQLISICCGCNTVVENLNIFISICCMTTTLSQFCSCNASHKSEWMEQCFQKENSPALSIVPLTLELQTLWLEQSLWSNGHYMFTWMHMCTCVCRACMHLWKQTCLSVGGHLH